jgi:phosphocarrier protein
LISYVTTVANETGVHLRPAGELADALLPLDCKVTIMKNGRPYDAKSIMMLSTANLKFGQEVEIVCDGPDEEKAMALTKTLIESQES